MQSLPQSSESFSQFFPKAHSDCLVYAEQGTVERNSTINDKIVTHIFTLQN
ncbi:hypothetical protein HJ01_03053 [Flavobacterium frigoris PS1]|uniref:Uncharacterized protein n=1 Tax=Flavobacterium frigoris (strain PS1) TaxID=1086011 RepID=H7FV55_FLAFP|nr:hypothetical protein HJ01_03053 [Flavobacterium frigoris PS1]